MRTTIVTVPQLRHEEPRPDGARGCSACSVCHTELPWIVDAAASDFDAVVDATMPVLVDLSAEWCAHAASSRPRSKRWPLGMRPAEDRQARHRCCARDRPALRRDEHPDAAPAPRWPGSRPRGGRAARARPARLAGRELAASAAPQPAQSGATSPVVTLVTSVQDLPYAVRLIREVEETAVGEIHLIADLLDGLGAAYQLSFGRTMSFSSASTLPRGKKPDAAIVAAVHDDCLLRSHVNEEVGEEVQVDHVHYRRERPDRNVAGVATGVIGSGSSGGTGSSPAPAPARRRGPRARD